MKEFQLISEVLDDGEAITQIKVPKDETLLSIHAKHYCQGKLVTDREVKVLKQEVQDDCLLLDIEPCHTVYWDEENFINIPMTLDYTIPGMTMNKRICRKGVDDFQKGEKHHLQYRLYIPTCTCQQHPLIIWLHGAGEGGHSNETQITGNRGGVAFLKYQDLFGGAYILAPQCPDYWMDSLTLGNLSLKGKDYTPQLVALIEDIIHEHQDIDTSRIYIGGCSMGGYQTWKTILYKPELFSAAFPICSAYKPTREDVKKVQHMPIWLTHARQDDIVPVTNSQTAYRYLKELNSPVTYSEYEDVVYQGVRYFPHGVWVYVLNNDPVCNGEHIMNWLAK